MDYKAYKKAIEENKVVFRKCSECGGEISSAIFDSTTEEDYSNVCPNCGNEKLELISKSDNYKDVLKDLTSVRNKISRQISTLKKANLN